jgi:hypothetical protein
VVFTYLNCIEVGPYEVVYKYPAISCRESRYNSWFSIVIVGLVFPVIGLPVGLIIVMAYLNKYYIGLLHYSSNYSIMVANFDTLACSLGTNWRALYKARFGILYETYKSHLPWWEAVALLRRTLFVVSAWLLFSDPRSRYQAFNLLNLIFLLIQLWVQPFEDEVG